MSRPQTMSACFEHLKQMVLSRRFREQEGLNNELPFFICPHPAAEMLEMDKMAVNLAEYCRRQGMNVLKIDLYDLAVEMLQGRGTRRSIWERVLQQEPSLPKAKLQELLQGVLNPETHLRQAITARIEAAPTAELMFITGVGHVYPYIRTHRVLNNLAVTAETIPILLFFPGEYTHTQLSGATLNLFGKLPNDRYYRAFDIYNMVPPTDIPSI